MQGVAVGADEPLRLMFSPVPIVFLLAVTSEAGFILALGRPYRILAECRYGWTLLPETHATGVIATRAVARFALIAPERRSFVRAHAVGTLENGHQMRAFFTTVTAQTVVGAFTGIARLLFAAILCDAG